MASRLRELVPDDRLVVAESGVREPRQIGRWRAQGFDARAGRRGLRAVGGPCRHRSVVRGGRSSARRSRQRRSPTVREDLRGDRCGRCPGRGPCRRRRDRPQLRPGHAKGAIAERGRRPRPPGPRGRDLRCAPADRRDHGRCLAGRARGDRGGGRSRRDPVQRVRVRRPGGRRPGARSGRSSTCRRRRPGTRARRRRRDRLPWPGLPGGGCDPDPARHRRRTASGRDRRPRGRGAGGGRRPRAPRDACRRPRSGQRVRRPPGHRRDRRGRRVRRGTPTELR